MLLILLLLCGMAAFIVKIMGGKDKVDSPSSSMPLPPSSVVTPPVTAAPPVSSAPIVTPADQKTIWDEYAEKERTINTFGVAGTDIRMISLPEYGRVDLSYFADAVFFGDSITTGWDLYRDASGMLPNAKVVAEISTSPPVNGVQWKHGDRVYDPMEEVVAYAPKKIYMMFGTNTLVNQSAATEDKLVADYATVIDVLHARLPDCEIYIQSILTPSPKGEQMKPGLTRERIGRVNSRLAALSIEKDCHYLDVQSMLCHHDGYLNSDIASGKDGIHFNADGYRGWLEYLVTHTGYSPSATYVGGSPYALLPTETPALAPPPAPAA
ncbi:MAG: GDSL-type esterase/lipase family protein [Pygmaiobacter sp.]